jgi:hypothetical protein
MAESFVKSFKRDYAYQYEPRTAAVVLENLPRLIDDYNLRRRPGRDPLGAPREIQLVDPAGMDAAAV